MVLSEIRVLICDDSILVRKKMTDLMTKLGCKEIYTTAADGNVVIVSDGAFLKVKTETAELAAAA